MQKKEFHEIAGLFPLMTESDTEKLAEDIHNNGLINPIILYEGKILDGRNRYNACILGSIEPQFEEFTGNDPLQYVISANLHRRHLNESQRAVIAGRLANMKLGDNQYRGSANLPEVLNQDANLHLDLEPPVNLPKVVSQTQAAEMLNVSTRMVTSAKAVEKEAPDLIVLKLEAVRIACRIRRYKFYNNYKNQFTIRNERPSGNKSELMKIIEGWGDYFFYGFSNPEKIKLQKWYLCDLKIFRNWFSKKLYMNEKKMLPGQIMKNKDNSSDFIVFNFNDLPGNFIIANNLT